MKHLRPGGWELSMLLASLGLYAGLVVETALIWIARPGVARALVQGVVTEVFTGREGGIPVALQGGAPQLLVFQYSVTQDLAAGFLVYPLFLYVLHRFWDSEAYVMRRLRRIESKARRHQEYVERWGPLGLYFFMLTPFLVNGPLFGLVLGRLAGMHTRNLLVPVVAATVTAAAVWTFFYEHALRVANSVDPHLGWWIAGGIAGLLSFLVAVDFVREHRAMRREDGPRAERGHSRGARADSDSEE